jgi:hypothetical protein
VTWNASRAFAGPDEHPTITRTGHQLFRQQQLHAGCGVPCRWRSFTTVAAVHLTGHVTNAIPVPAASGCSVPAWSVWLASHAVARASKTDGLKSLVEQFRDERQKDQGNGSLFIGSFAGARRRPVLFVLRDYAPGTASGCSTLAPRRARDGARNASSGTDFR